MPRSSIVIPFPLVGSLFLLAVVYAFGLGGVFFIDDAPNLDGMLLPGVGMADFVLGGNAGPLGRPVALWTFWLQRAAYPQGTTPFLLVNLAIHLVNVALLAWAVQRLQRVRPDVLGQQTWVPLAAALVWGVMPIHASASLMVIQRMTTLCASFMLLGVHAFLWARAEAAAVRPGPCMVALLALGCCGVLAVFTKENGALLPLLLLVLHVTLLRHRDGVVVNFWQRLLALALWLPSLVLLVYVGSRLPSIAGAYWRRPFSLDERMASQAVILWDYLQVAFVPAWAKLHPFQDDYPIRHFSDGIVQLALLAWCLWLAAALWLWRKGRPLLAFALLWYWAGHLLESSVFPLFLYFEHRNYVPLMGPVLAAVVWFSRLPLGVLWRYVLGGGYLLFLAVVLWQTTSTWGQRQLLAWAQLHPDSPRALQMLAGAYMQAGKVPEVLAMYQSAVQRKPDQTSLALQGLRASCYMPDAGVSTAHWLPLARTSVVAGVYSGLSISSLQATEALQAQGRCAGLQPGDVLGLAKALQANPMYAAPADQAALHRLRAGVLLQTDRATEAITQLRQAVALDPDMDAVILLLRTIRKVDGDDAAKAFLQEMRQLPLKGRNERFRQSWQTALHALAAQLNQR